METITIYRTSDGSEFDDKDMAEARQHRGGERRGLSLPGSENGAIT